MTVLGFDLSQHNTVENFDKAYEAGYRFAIIKASEGTTYRDPKFSAYWPQLIDRGFLVGVYHFFRSNMDGIAQANNFLDAIQPLINYAPKRLIGAWVDLESEDATAVAARMPRLGACCNMIRAGFRKPGIYSSKRYWDPLTNSASLGDIWGWVAHWTDAATPILPMGWPASNVKFWQFGIYPTYSWVPAVPGIANKVDVNRFLGTYEELLTFAGAEIPESPSPPVPPTHADLQLAMINAIALLDAAHDKLDGLKASHAEILAKIGGQSQPPTPPPANLGVYQVAAEEKANGHWQIGTNAKGKPVLGLPPVGSRLQWNAGQQIQVILPEADVDGSTRFWVVYGKSYSGNVFNNPRVYVKEGDGVLVG